MCEFALRRRARHAEPEIRADGTAHQTPTDWRPDSLFAKQIPTMNPASSAVARIAEMPTAPDKGAPLEYTEVDQQGIEL